MLNSVSERENCGGLLTPLFSPEGTISQGVAGVISDSLMCVGHSIGDLLGIEQSSASETVSVGSIASLLGDLHDQS